MKAAINKIAFTISNILCLLLFVMLSTGFAGVLSVKISPHDVTLAPGQSAELALVYDVPQGTQKTAGLGFRVYYNSNIIDKLTLQENYGEGLIAVDEAPQDDVENADHDGTTDKSVGIAWVDMAGDWPSMMTLPVILGTIVLQVKNDAQGTTPIKIIPTGVPELYQFQAEDAFISVQ